MHLLAVPAEGLRTLVSGATVHGSLHVDPGTGTLSPLQEQEVPSTSVSPVPSMFLT